MTPAAAPDVRAIRQGSLALVALPAPAWFAFMDFLECVAAYQARTESLLDHYRGDVDRTPAAQKE